ncbi:MAG TPA: hypothetical protein VNR37_09265 [Microbacteriaceae bacterium]|nr:hypothetical protein [Microbacteriaceae bacterium]
MDDLTRLLRENNPFRDAPLPERATRRLDDIISGRRETRHDVALPPFRSHRTPALLAGVAFVVTLVVVALVLVSVRPQVAMAVTPNLLELRPTVTTIDTLREDLVKSPLNPRPTATSRGAQWEGWFIQLDADRPVATFIQPQRVQIAWGEDFSGSSRIVAGTPMAADGSVIEPVPAGAAVPGTTLYEETWGPGEYPVPFPEAPPEDAAGMRGYLDAFLASLGVTETGPRSAGEYLYALSSLMQFWTLGDAAQRAAIEVIVSAPGIQVAGETIDRAGRAGVVLDIAPTELEPGYRTQLVIDIQSWRLLAVERISIAGDPDFHIAPDSVTDYTLWR